MHRVPAQAFLFVQVIERSRFQRMVAARHLSGCAALVHHSPLAQAIGLGHPARAKRRIVGRDRVGRRPPGRLPLQRKANLDQRRTNDHANERAQSHWTISPCPGVPVLPNPPGSQHGTPRRPVKGLLKIPLAIPRNSRYSGFSMAARESNPNFMNGVPELLILRLLQQEEMYGYEIVQAIRRRTGAVIAVGEGVVYPVLHALEKSSRPFSLAPLLTCPGDSPCGVAERTTRNGTK